ncbi:hypothetical protein Tco_1415805, partial [Tanacetum coccineum]
SPLPSYEEKMRPLPRRKVTCRRNHKINPSGTPPSEDLTSERMTRQKLTQSFACGIEITFPPLANSDGTEGPLVIEAEIGGHMIHRMYIDGGIKEIQAVPSTAHGMLKFPVDGGIVTIRSTILIPSECATVITSPKEIPKEAGTSYQNLKVAIHLNFPNQRSGNWGDIILSRMYGTMHTLEEKLRYIRVAAIGHDRSTAINS